MHTWILCNILSFSTRVLCIVRINRDFHIEFVRIAEKVWIVFRSTELRRSHLVVNFVEYLSNETIAECVINKE